MVFLALVATAQLELVERLSIPISTTSQVYEAYFDAEGITILTDSSALEVLPFLSGVQDRQRTVSIWDAQRARFVSDSSGQRWFLRGTEDQGLVSQRSYPFAAYLLRRGATETVVSPPIEMSDSTEWIGLPLVHGVDGFLRMFADPYSDRRAIAVYNSSGQIKHVTWIAAPLAITDGLPSGHVLALRQVGSFEAVVYQLASSGNE